MNELYDIPLFAGIPAAELEWMIANSTEIELATGDYFFRENQPTDEFYIVLHGELQVTRTVGGKERVVGTTPRGIIGGELALLYGMPSQVSSRALEPSTLMVFKLQSFREMFTFAPSVATEVLKIAAHRTQGLAASAVQQEKMAALGKLSAGLAHELNNPAAAAARAADTLRETLPRLEAQLIKLSSVGLSEQHVQHVVAFQQDTTVRARAAEPLSPLAQSDREDELIDWLEDHEVAQAWDLASCFATNGVRPADLATFAEGVPAESLGEVLRWVHTTLDATSLLDEIEQSTHRISDLVGAVKAYTYRDQGTVQDVDIHKGLETTLTVLKHKIKKGNVQIVREYAPDLPTIRARGGELNQVWTNLIDNAIDAIAGEGTIRLITRCEQDFVMVEVTDDGMGIPPEVMPRLFEPFFTTKDVGAGTGLGLDISYRIIQEHHGTVEVQSKPGNTRFIVRLPIAASGAED